MREVSRSALVPYSAGEMYALVADIAAYPSFLPWCHGAIVHSKSDSLIEASLELSRAGLRKSFRTRNRLWPDERMDMTLVDGPFRHLDGGWRFQSLGVDGCKVTLQLEFEFENFITDTIFGHYFEETCSRLIDSFTHRAREVYG